MTLALSGCTQPPLDEWTEVDQYVVVSVDGRSLLAGLNSTDHTISLVADLGSVGLREPTSVEVDNSVDPVLLSWNADNQATQFATIDGGSKTISELNYSVDSGSTVSAGGNIYSVLPQVSGDSEIEIASIGTGEVSSQIEVKPSPSFLAQGSSTAIVVGIGWDGSVFVQEIIGLEPQEPVQIAPTGIPGDVVLYDGGIAFTIVRAAAEGGISAADPSVGILSDDGEIKMSLSVNDPRILTPAGAGKLALDDTVDGVRTIRVLSLTDFSQIAQFELESVMPVLGMSSDDEGMLTILQSDRVSWLNADSGELISEGLPGASITTW